MGDAWSLLVGQVANRPILAQRGGIRMVSGVETHDPGEICERVARSIIDDLQDDEPDVDAAWERWTREWLDGLDPSPADPTWRRPLLVVALLLVVLGVGAALGRVGHTGHDTRFVHVDPPSAHVQVVP